MQRHRSRPDRHRRGEQYGTASPPFVGHGVVAVGDASSTCHSIKCTAVGGCSAAVDATTGAVSVSTIEPKHTPSPAVALIDWTSFYQLLLKQAATAARPSRRLSTPFPDAIGGTISLNSAFFADNAAFTSGRSDARHDDRNHEERLRLHQGAGGGRRLDSDPDTLSFLTGCACFWWTLQCNERARRERARFFIEWIVWREMS